jgi:DNA-binding LytR/AlgR family response regulator
VRILVGREDRWQILPEKHGGEVMTDAGSIRILVANDHPVVREGVAAASNGREAIQQFREGHPDVVLMDLQMPLPPHG